MSIERMFELAFSHKVDAGKLSYPDMMYYVEHNVFLYINSLAVLAAKKEAGNI